MTKTQLQARVQASKSAQNDGAAIGSSLPVGYAANSDYSSLMNHYTDRGCTINEATRLIKRFHPQTMRERFEKSSPGDFWEAVKKTRRANPEKTFSEAVEITKRNHPALHVAALGKGCSHDE